MSATATIGTTTATAMRPPAGSPPPLSDPPAPEVWLGSAPVVVDEVLRDDELRVLVSWGKAGAGAVEVISIV